MSMNSTFEFIDPPPKSPTGKQAQPQSPLASGEWTTRVGFAIVGMFAGFALRVMTASTNAPQTISSDQPPQARPLFSAADYASKAAEVAKRKSWIDLSCIEPIEIDGQIQAIEIRADADGGETLDDAIGATLEMDMPFNNDGMKWVYHWARKLSEGRRVLGLAMQKPINPVLECSINQHRFFVTTSGQKVLVRIERAAEVTPSRESR